MADVSRSRRAVRVKQSPMIGALRRNLLSRPSPLILAMMATLSVPGIAHAQAVNLGSRVTANKIIPDGRTRTRVVVHGNRTAITTNTVSKGTGFNSFSDFQEAAGQNVDLYVPNGAGNLVNIVRNGSVVVNGVLKSYKNGKIGGNVYFSDPHGFIVGQKGTINVGSLTVNTPTSQFLDGVISRDGKVNDAAAGRLMRGEFATSPDGFISISGVVNARDGITLQGQEVNIHGARPLDSKLLTQRDKFEATVNGTGLREGARLVSRNGSVSIVAAGDVNLGGQIDVSASRRRPGRGGRIQVSSGGNINIAATASLAAAGFGADGAGGDIVIKAGGTLVAPDGARFSAHGAGAGAGGFVDLSGQVAEIGAVDVDLGSDHGAAGTLLFDPDDLIITATNGIASGGANVELDADNSITIASGGFIDTTNGASQAGNITLKAPDIVLDDGSKLDAGSGATAGTIKLDAEQPTGGVATIDIGNATIHGGAIDLIASSTISSGIALVTAPDAEAAISIDGAQITTSGKMTVTATADSEGTLGRLPVGLILNKVAATIDVVGSTSIDADSASFASKATAVSDVETASIAPSSSSADGAVAISTVDSTARSHIGGDAQVTTHGDDGLSLSADNSVSVTANATPHAAAFGASVAVSVIDAETSATIDGAAIIKAQGNGGLSLSANTATAATLTAAAATGGASTPEQGSESQNYLDQYSQYADAGDAGEGGGSSQKVSVVGALAISDLTSTTTATMDSSQKATVAGALAVDSTSANGAALTADGSAVDSTVGVGVALGINLAKVRNDATIAQDVDAGSVEISAPMNDANGASGTNSFTTSATSGAGGENVGVAGSLATNLVDTESVATIAPNVTVNVTANGPVAISSNDVSESDAKAVPDETGATGGKVGVGASIALNIVANRSTAEIGNGAVVTGATDLSLSANAVHTINTEADAGSSGGVSLTPALALSMVDNSTTADLGAPRQNPDGTFVTQDAGGNVTVSAVQQATETTTASGKAAGSKAAIGAALALALIDDDVSATTSRDIDAATGAVSFTAMGASLSTLTADASASGAAAAEDNGDAGSGQPASVDDTVNSEFGSAESKQSDAGVGDSEQQGATKTGVDDKEGHSASSSDGSKVSVAAAVGVNVQQSHVTASVPDAINITAGGALTIKTANNTDGIITADGSAVGGDNAAQVGIGAAVAVNDVHTVNDATLGVATHSVGGLDIEATKLDIAALVADPTSTATRSDNYQASATSGAGGSKVGIAGSLGLNLVDTESAATVTAGSNVTITGNGSVTLFADNETSSTAKALPDETGASGGKVGVGASVALNIVANRSTAEIEDNAVVTGANDLSLSANAVHTIDTEAEAGSEGGVSVTPVLALSMVNDSTTAQLGMGATQNAAGDVTISAVQQANETTNAKGQAKGGTAAVGAALALALINDDVSATTHRAIDASGAVTFAAMGASLSTLDAEASASGAAADAEDSKGADSGAPAAGQPASVDDQVDNQLGGAETKQTDSGVGDSAQQGETKTGVDDKSGHSAQSSQGKVTVAAAVGVNVQNSSVVASVPDTIDITAGGALTIKTANNTDGQITANGSAVGDAGAQAEVGIGAAVAVNAVHTTNDATLGVGTHLVGGLDIEATKLDIAALVADPTSTATRADTYLASATSGAGGTKIGIAGSLGLNLIDTESAATITAGSAVTVTGGGDVTLFADNQTKTTASALPVEGTSGGKLGIGASVALNIIANRSLAEIGDGVALSGVEDLSLTATADHEIETEAEAGAAGGVALTPALALALVSDTTTAQLGTGSLISASGDVEVEAEQSAKETTSASAKAAGDKAAIGAALAVALVNDDVLATTNRGIHADGDVSFAATGSSAGTLTVTASASGAKAADDSGNAQSGDESVDQKVDDQLSFGSGEQTNADVGSSDQQGDTKTAEGGDHSAKTSEGKLSVAAAIGVNVVTSSTVAALPDGVDVSAVGTLSVTTVNATDGSVTADASAVGSQVGIGAAAAVNAIHEINQASLGDANYQGNGVTVSALKAANGDPAHIDTFDATATSGAGGTKVGIAGSLALNLITVDDSATIATGAIVDAGSGASTIAAEEDMAASASAKPTGDTTGGKLGIGASVALNLITSTVTAELDDGATFSNGGDLTVNAKSGIDTETEAEAGSEGGVAIDAVVALATLDETTTARVGTGAALDLAGALDIEAFNEGDDTATATGDTKSSNVGVGAAAAVIIGGGSSTNEPFSDTSSTLAELARGVTASALTLSADADRSYTADATATAGGAKDESSGSDNKSTSTETLNKTSVAQEGTSGSEKSGGGKISIAAAAGVAAAQDHVSALLDDVTVTLTGDLDLDATNVSRMATLGSGAAAGSKGQASNVGIGVGVALSIVNDSTTATIADGATIAGAGEIAVKAASYENVDQTSGDSDFAHSASAGSDTVGVGAEAYAGAASTKVSVAGAFAIEYSTSTTLAAIGDDVAIGSSSNPVGAVTVQTDNTSSLSSLASSKATGGKVGVGASIAVNYSDNSYIAALGAGDAVYADGLSVTATNHKVVTPSAFDITQYATPSEIESGKSLTDLQTGLETTPLIGVGNYYAEAIGGSQGSSAAIQGSFAVMVFDDAVNASIGKSLDGSSTATTTIDADTGAVTLLAQNDFGAAALSGALAVSTGAVGVGVSSSVIVSSGTTESLLAGNAEIDQAGSLSDKALASQDISVFGISAAGGDEVGIAGVATVVTSENDVEALIGAGAAVTVDDGVTLGAQNDLTTFSVAGGLGISGSVGVGAAASAIVVDDKTIAAIEDMTNGKFATINAGGEVDITADATEDGTTIVAAGAAAGSVAAGAGAAVYTLDTDTEATLGAYTQIGQANAPSSVALSASDATSLDTFAGAVAGGGTAGVGAGAAVGVIGKTVIASIGDNAKVTAGDVGVSATSSETADTLSAGVGIGGDAGLAGAVSVYSVTDTTTASIGSDAAILAQDNVAVLANDDTDISFLSGAIGLAGSAGVGASAGVAIIDATTHATIASGADVTALGLGAGVDYVSAYTPDLTAYGAIDGSTIAAPSTGMATPTSADGEVLSADDAENEGLRLLALERSSTPVTATGHGVVVNAGDVTSMRALVIGGAVGGSAGVALSADVPVVTSDTEATIADSANINQHNDAGAASDQSVIVAAASDLYHLGVAGSAAGGGAAGVGGGVEVAILSPKTIASIGDGVLIAAKQDVAVTANAGEDFVGAAAAGAVGGTVAGAGGFSVFSLTTDTQATVGNNGTIDAGGNVVVLANDITRSSILAGAVAIGVGGGGLGTSVGLTLLTKDTEATIGTGATVNALGNGAAFDAYTGADFTDTRSATGLLVEANSNESAFTLGIAGAGGLYAGIAGAVTIQLFDVTTVATIGANDQIDTANAGAAATQDVTVTARDSTSLAVDDAAAAISGFASISGAVDVGILRNTTAASIGDGATVDAKRNVDVAGLQNISTDSTVLSASGALVGIAAGISVYSIGDGLAPDSSGADNLKSSDGGSVSDYASGQLNSGTLESVLGASSNSDVQDTNTKAQAARNNVNLDALNDTTSIPGGTSATIGTASIDAGGAVTVQSGDTLASTFTGGAIAGGAAGLGAGIGIVTVDTTNTANDSVASVSAASMAVAAATAHTLTGADLAGTFSAGLSVQAAVATFTDDSTTSAALHGATGLGASTVNLTGALAIDASDDTTVDEAAGAAGVSISGGSASAGAGVAVLTKHTSATIDGNATIDAGDLAVDAESAEHITADTVGLGVGGMAGGAGAVSVAVVTDTTTAEIGSGARITAQDNAAVLANDATQIDALIGGVGGGGVAGIGASIGVAVITATTHALIDDGAEVTAFGNGNALTYVTEYDGDFTAYGSGDAFEAPSIDSSKISSSGGTVDAPVSAGDAEAAGLDLLGKARSSTPITASAHGVVVNATDANALRSVTVGGGIGGGVGISLSANVPVVIADTEARVDGAAKINQAAGTSANGQSVAVAAASDFYDLGVAGSVSGGGVAAGGAGTVVAVVSQTTKALVSTSATLSAKDDIGVTAKAREDFAEAAAAGSVGGLGSLAGGVTAVALTDVTTAELGGTANAGGNINVVADDETRTAMLAGAVAASGGLGLGASIAVVDLDKTTTADIAANAHVTALGTASDQFDEYSGSGFSATQQAKGINILADSGESDLTVAVAGAAGLDAGVSGVISLELMNVTTTADIGADAAINANNAGASSQQDVSVAARDSTTTLTLDGGFAAGFGVGLAGTIDVGIFKNTTDAYIADGATVNAAGDVLVTALANRAGDSTTVSGSAGILALAAGISIYDYGNGVDPDGDAAGHIAASSSSGSLGLGDIVSEASGQVGNGEVNDLLAQSDNPDVVNAGTSMNGKRSSLALMDATTPLNVPAGTSASIGNAAIAATGSVDVQSVESTTTQFTTGAAAIGLAGLGAGVGVVTVDAGNTAQIKGTATIQSHDLTVKATTGHTLSGASFAGAVGLEVAAEADVAVITDDSATDAFILGSTLKTASNIDIEANVTRGDDAEAKGGAIGGAGAIGASVAIVNLDGEASAYLGLDGAQSVTIGSTANTSGALTIKAHAQDSATANAVAVAGGIGVAADGAAATADVGTDVSASTDAATIYSSGQVLIQADAEDSAETTTTGLAISAILSAGASIAQSTLGATVLADIDGGSIQAGSLELDAWASHLNAPDATASASGSSGAFVGINATEADASNNSSVHASAEGAAFGIADAMTLQALNNTSQEADADGNAFGVVAVGGNVADASSNTHTLATLLDLSSLTAGSLSLIATGNDGNVANATAGSGGLVAGSAAEADTSSTSDTEATAKTTSASTTYHITVTGAVDIAATHTTNFYGTVDSTQAAAVGMSGATLNHAVDSTVNAALGDNADLEAADLAIAAHNITHNFFDGEPVYGLYPGATAPSASFDADSSGWNVDSGSGGLLNLPAGRANVTITHVTTASIGNDADVHLIAPTSGLSTLAVEAYNEIIAHEKAKLDSGGAIATAEADVDIEVPTDSATVTFGHDSQILVDMGDIEAAAWGNADLDGRSAATTYGVAGAPSGKSYANLNVTDRTEVGARTELQATDGIDPTDGSTPTHGTIGLYAGASLVGGVSSLLLHTTVDLYNNSAIPISSTPDAQSNVVDNATVLVDSEAGAPSGTVIYGVNAAGDVTIGAERGTISTTAIGTGTDIYREALAKAASAISNAFGGGDVTFDYHGGSTSNTGAGTVTIDGLVDTGLQRYKTLTVGYAETNTDINNPYSPSCDVSTSDCLVVSGNIGVTISAPQPVGTDIIDRLAQLQALLSQYGSDPVAKGAYQSEITFLEKKLVALGLGSFDSSGNFIPNAYSAPTAAQLQQEVTDTQSQITSTNAQFGGATGSVYVPSTTTYADSIDSSYTDGTFGYQVTVNAVLAQIAKLSQYSAVKDGSAYTTALANLNAALSALGTAAASVSTQAGDLTTAQANIVTATNNLIAAETAFATAVSTGASTVAAAANITTYEGQIVSYLSNIGATSTSGYVGALASAAQTVVSNATTINNDLDTLIGLARQTGTANDTEKSEKAADDAIVNALNATNANPQDAGANTQLGLIVTQFGTQQSNITANITLINSAVTALGQDAATAGSLDNYVVSLSGLSSQLGNEQLQVANAGSANPQPMASQILVADTAARLGNISIIGDSLGGAGQLSAPGDAKIIVHNQTADALVLGNMLIPEYDAGHVRFNGILVNTNAGIDDINAGGVTANFSSITTASDSDRGLVQISSDYNADSAAYYDPNPRPGEPYWLTHQKVAPDIILNQGAVIDNQTGAVDIASASGNIYINGSINAGSVSILAKNGDFVSSYVDGFDNIGGDPAAFNVATDPNEAGPGILANGEISIAARYLNINSTIQSGIADWNVNLTGTPTLTTNVASDIGLDNSTVADDIANYLTKLKSGTATAADEIVVFHTTYGDVTLTMAPSNGITLAELNADAKDYQDKINANPLTPPSPLYHETVNGQPVTINIKDYLSAGIAGQLQFSKTTADNYAASGATGNLNYTVVSTTDNIGVVYQPGTGGQTGQYVVDGTSVHGGYIQLYGQIMNTAYVNGGTPVGQLNVLDGFGTINITNTSDIPVVLSTLSAGDDPTGTLRGTQGTIDITDVTGVNVSDPANPVVDVKHTIYTRDYTPGDATGQVMVAVQHGTIDQVTGEIDPTDAWNIQGNGNDRTAEYDPTPDQRYVWTTGTDYTAVTQFEEHSHDFFGDHALSVDDITKLTATSGPDATATRRLDDGTYVTTDSTQTGTATATVGNSDGGVILDNSVGTETNASLDGTVLVQSTYAYLTYNDLPPPVTHSSCDPWLCITSSYTADYTLTQKYTEITTNSLKADNPIGINFLGSNTGGITVDSASDIVATNTISAPAGTVTICAGGTCTGSGGTASIIEGNLAGAISAKTIDLQASGSIGGVTYGGNPAAPVKAPIMVNLTEASAAQGALNAAAANGVVSISSRGDLRIGQVTAAGDPTDGNGQVNLAAAGSIVGASSSSLIQAPRVILTATNGSIMGSSGNLAVNTGYDGADSVTTFGPNANENPYYGLSATAAGDIGIISSSWTAANSIGNTDGTILVDQVVSTGGNVTLSSSGYILDNNPIETVDTRTYQQLLAYWNSLDLLAGAGNTAKQAATVAAYEQTTNQEYQDYWRIRDSQANGGAVYDPSFQIVVAPGTALYNALTQQFTADVTAANPTYTSQQIANAVAQKISDYEASQTANYQTLNSEVGGLNGGAYSSTYTFALDPNNANDAQTIAQLTRGAVWTQNELAFTISPGALKTVTATNPVLKDPNVSGRVVTIDAKKGIGETVGAGTADPGVSIQGGMSPADLTDAQKVALASAERPDLELIVSMPGGDVTVPLGTAYDDLTPTEQAALDAAASKGFPADKLTIKVLSKRPLNFNASSSLNVSVTDTPPSTPNASMPDDGDAYLASRGDAALGTIETQGDTRIKVIGSITNASNSLIRTGNLILEAAQGSIGVIGGDPLDLDSQSLGSTINTITARAEGGVNLNVNGTANVDTIYSPNDVTLTASDGITNANGDQLVNILGTVVTLRTANGSIGDIGNGNPLNVGVNFGGGIYATAAQDIDLYGPSTNSFIVKSADAGRNITLDSGADDIIDGLVTAPGVLNLDADGRLVITGAGDVEATNGAITVDAGAMKMLNGAQMLADFGAIAITTQDDALVTGIISGSTAANAVSIDAGGHVLAGTDPTRTDITTTAPAAGVVITAGLGIGDETEADDAYVDGANNVPGSANLVTDVPNPLRIKSGSLALTATAGDLDVEALSAVLSASLTAGSGNIDVAADQSFHATDVTATLGNIGIAAAAALTLDDLNAGGSIGASSTGGPVTVGRATSGTGQSYNAALAIDLATVNAGTAISANSTGSTVTLGTATSGGTQSYQAANDVTFTDLTTTGIAGDTGDVDITSRDGAILGGDIHAHGSAHLDGQSVDLDAVNAGLNAVINATGDILATTLNIGKAITATSTAGTVTVNAATSGTSQSFNAAKDIDLTTVNAGTTIGANSTGGAVTVGTATSGGTQSFEAASDVTFTDLTTTGIRGDAGDVDITSYKGAIRGGDIHANGSTHLFGNGIYFDTIVAGMDSLLTSTGDIIGQGQEAGGTVNDHAGSTGGLGSIRIGRIHGTNLIFDATGDLTLPNLEVAKDIVLRGGNIDASITQVPSGPDALHMTLTGGNGSVGRYANILVDAPAGLAVDDLFFVDSVLRTSARAVSIANAYVPGSLWLYTPLQALFFDDRTPFPQAGNDTQFYQPGFAFSFRMKNYRSTSNAYVVRYDASAQSTDILSRLPFDGVSLVRDSIRFLRSGDENDWIDVMLQSTTETKKQMLVDVGDRIVVIDGVEYPVATSGDGPAVRLDHQH